MVSGIRTRKLDGSLQWDSNIPLLTVRQTGTASAYTSTYPINLLKIPRSSTTCVIALSLISGYTVARWCSDSSFEYYFTDAPANSVFRYAVYDSTPLIAASVSFPSYGAMTRNPDTGQVTYHSSLVPLHISGTLDWGGSYTGAGVLVAVSSCSMYTEVMYEAFENEEDGGKDWYYRTQESYFRGVHRNGDNYTTDALYAQSIQTVHSTPPDAGGITKDVPLKTSLILKDIS